MRFISFRKNCIFFKKLKGGLIKFKKQLALFLFIVHVSSKLSNMLDKLSNMIVLMIIYSHTIIGVDIFDPEQLKKFEKLL